MSVHDFRWMERENTSEREAGANTERAAIVAFIRRRLGSAHSLASLIETGEHLCAESSDRTLLIHILSTDDDE